MRRTKVIAILLAIALAAGLMASPVYAGGASANLQAILESPSTIHAWGSTSIDWWGYTSYLRAYEDNTTKLLSEHWAGDGSTAFDTYMLIDTPVPNVLKVEVWALYLYPGETKAQLNDPGSLFWRLVNNWAVPAPSIAHAGISVSPDLPLPSGSELLRTRWIYSPNILASTRAAVFENHDDNIVITIAHNGAVDDENGLRFNGSWDEDDDIGYGIGVLDPLEAPFAIESENCTDGYLYYGDTCEIVVSFDAASVAAGSTMGMGGIYAKAGIGSSILLIGFVLSAGGIRRRRLVAAVIILALIMGIGMLQACGDENTYYANLPKKPHYIDTFDIRTNDPDERSITIGLGAYK